MATQRMRGEGVVVLKRHHEWINLWGWGQQTTTTPPATPGGYLHLLTIIDTRFLDLLVSPRTHPFLRFFGFVFVFIQS